MAVRTQSIEKSRLGRLLVNKGLITDAQLNRALVESHAAGQRLGEFLVAGGLISEKQLNQTLRRQKRVRHVATFLAMLIAPFQPMMAMSAAAATTSTTQTVALKITTQPVSTTAAEGTKASFSMAATGTSLKYQWFKNGKRISGATSATLSFSAVTSGDGAYYFASITDGKATLWSDKVWLTVTPKTASSTTTSSSTSTTTSPTTTTTTTTGTTSTVTSGTLSITQQPTSVTSEVGKAAAITMKITAKAPTFQWYKDGKILSGATQAQIQFSALGNGDAGYYFAKITDGSAVTWTNRAWVTVNPATVTPTPTPTPTPTSTSTLTSGPLAILTQPTSLTQNAGTRAAIIMSVSAKAPSFQWYKDGKKLDGVNSAQVQFDSLAKADAGYYFVKITDGSSVTWSQRAYVTVNDAPVTAPTPKLDIQVSLQPVGASVFAGKSHTFNIAATGSGTLKYQWRKNGSPIANAVLPYLSLSAIKLSDAAQYDVLITNTTGTVTSQAVKLDVAIDRSAKLSWVPPTTRVNGTALKAGDIASYRIYHSTEDGAVEQVYDVSAAQNLYEMSGLVSGKHFFAITAIDTKGYESDLSNMANKEILTGL